MLSCRRFRSHCFCHTHKRSNSYEHVSDRAAAVLKLSMVKSFRGPGPNETRINVDSQRSDVNSGFSGPWYSKKKENDAPRASATANSPDNHIFL